MHNQIQKHMKPRQKQRYNTIAIFRSILFPVITLSYICFLSITSMIFKATVKSLQYSLHPAMVIDSSQKRFVIYMKLRQCFVRAKPFRLFLIFKKSESFSKKAGISKSGFKKAELATLSSR